MIESLLSILCNLFGLAMWPFQGLNELQDGIQKSLVMTLMVFFAMLKKSSHQHAIKYWSYMEALPLRKRGFEETTPVTSTWCLRRDPFVGKMGWSKYHQDKQIRKPYIVVFDHQQKESLRTTILLFAFLPGPPGFVYVTFNNLQSLNVWGMQESNTKQR